VADGRTDGWLSKNVFQPFFSHIRVLSKRMKNVLYKRIKRGYDSKKAEKRFLDHIRVLSFLIKRGYDSKKAEKRFLDHIRVLSFWINADMTQKRLKNVFWTISVFYPFG
jgi:hypothetical protein